MSDDVKIYFATAIKAVDYLLGCKREWTSSCGRLANPRYDASELWKQIRPLLLRANEEFYTGIDELIFALRERFEPITDFYDEARGDFRSVIFNGREAGTACEMVQLIATEVQSWLRSDQVGWPTLVSSIDDVRELRQWMECSESHFPLSFDDAERLKSALRTERSFTSREKKLQSRVVDLVKATIDSSNNKGELASDEECESVSHTPDFDSITVDGKSFPLRGHQADLMRFLWTRASEGHAIVSLEAVGRAALATSWSATFRDSPAKQFIVKPHDETGKVIKSAITLSFADRIPRISRKSARAQQAHR